MRSRKEIEETFKDIIVPAGQGNIRVELELLLDIRQLLIEEKEEKFLARLIREREEAKKEREAKQIT